MRNPVDARNGARAPAVLDIEGVLREVAEIYARAGARIPDEQLALAQKLIASFPAEKRLRIPARLANYCKWALFVGKWDRPATVKQILNLLRSGDWDVEPVERQLPPAPAPEKQSVIERKSAEYLRRHQKGAL